ncbi:MAG: 50S ribosomal protein L19 [Phycisphaerales bacterium]
MNIQQTIESLNTDAIKKDIPRMDIGDTISVHCRIIEGAKERIQVFTGVLISRSGAGVNEMICVRRLVEEMGVERILPINSPKIAQIDVLRRGNARRAKLYFLRDRAGKSSRVIDRRRGLKHVAGMKLASQN